LGREPKSRRPSRCSESVHFCQQTEMICSACEVDGSWWEAGETRQGPRGQTWPAVHTILGSLGCHSASWFHQCKAFNRYLFWSSQVTLCISPPVGLMYANPEPKQAQQAPQARACLVFLSRYLTKHTSDTGLFHPITPSNWLSPYLKSAVIFCLGWARRLVVSCWPSNHSVYSWSLFAKLG
jgi:hypothetical protein